MSNYGAELTIEEVLCCIPNMVRVWLNKALAPYDSKYIIYAYEFLALVFWRCDKIAAASAKLKRKVALSSILRSNFESFPRRAALSLISLSIERALL